LFLAIVQLYRCYKAYWGMTNPTDNDPDSVSEMTCKSPGVW